MRHMLPNSCGVNRAGTLDILEKAVFQSWHATCFVLRRSLTLTT